MTLAQEKSRLARLGGMLHFAKADARESLMEEIKNLRAYIKSLERENVR